MPNIERPRCCFCDRPFNNQNDLIVHQGVCAEVRISAVFPPIGTRQFDYSAVLDSYDGAQDAGWQPVGYGPTREAAREDLANEIEEHEA
jgi:hypothetical protein